MNTNSCRAIMGSSRRPARHAVAMLELLLGVLILSFGIIPIYYVFTTSKATVFKSEMSYVALMAAREHLDELRLLPADVLMALSQQGEGQWRSVEGNAFAFLLTVTQGRDDKAPMTNADGSVGQALPQPNFNLPQLAYPDYYKRVKLKTTIEWLMPLAQGTVQQNNAPPSPPYLFKAIVHVRWQERGEEVQRQEQDKPKHFVSKLESVFSVGGFGEGSLR